MSGIESLLHVVEDPHRLVGIQLRLRVERNSRKMFTYSALPSPSLGLAKPGSERVQQHPIDIARLFQTGNVGHFAIAVPAENVAVFARSQDAPHAAEARSHVPARQASGRAVPALHRSVRHDAGLGAGCDAVDLAPFW
jgi:hypothetical protein